MLYAYRAINLLFTIFAYYINTCNMSFINMSGIVDKLVCYSSKNCFGLYNRQNMIKLGWTIYT
jgi:hypothetical protein